MQSIPYCQIHHTPFMQGIEQRARRLFSRHPNFDQLSTFDSKQIFLAQREVGNSPKLIGKVKKMIPPEEVKEKLQELTKFWLDNPDESLPQLIEALLSDEEIRKAIITGDLRAAMREEAKYPSFSCKNGKELPGYRLKLHMKAFINFFPRLINSFLECFGEDKRPGSLWETYLLLEVYLKFFLIPCAIFHITVSLIATASIALLVTAAITLALLASLCVYLGLKGPPNSLPNATCLSEEPRQPYVDQAVTGDGQALVQMLLNCRNPEGKSNHVILVADSGFGKTAAVREFAFQLKQREPDAKVFSISAGDFTESNFTPVKAPAFKEKLKIIQGFEKKIIFFIDDFHGLSTDPKAMDILGQEMDTRDIMIIGVTTPQGEEKLEKVTESYPALRSRFQYHKISVSRDKRDLIKIFQEHALVEASEIPIDPEVFTYCAEKYETDQPRVGLQVLREAINKVSLSSNPDNFVSPALAQKKLELQDLRRQRKYAKGREDWELLQRIDRVREEKKRLKEEDAITRRNLCSLQHLRLSEKVWRKKLYKAAKNGDAVEFIFIHTLLLPVLEVKMLRVESQLSSVPTRVTVDIIKKKSS